MLDRLLLLMPTCGDVRYASPKAVLDTPVVAVFAAAAAAVVVLLLLLLLLSLSLMLLLLLLLLTRSCLSCSKARGLYMRLDVHLTTRMVMTPASQVYQCG